MKEFDPSATAAMTAALRAVHFKYNEGEKLYSDPFGEVFTNSFYRLLIQSPLLYRLAKATYYKRLLTAEGWIVGRARFVQNELETFINEFPNHQVVILGAGYDSFALKPEIASKCKVIFEVDHPATMGRKRKIISEKKIPNQVQFVSVNFETQRLFTRLTEAGFRSDIPTFFSWTGNVFYLSKEAVSLTFNDIYNNVQSELRLAFDYMDPLVLDEKASITLKEMRAYVARWCEPWINPYSKSEISILLESIGFKLIKHLDEQTQDSEYFSSFERLHSTEGFRWLLIKK